MNGDIRYQMMEQRSNKLRQVPTAQINPRMALLPAFHGLITHFYQTRLCFAVWELADGSNCLVSIFLRQSTSFFNAITSMDNLTRLN